jgi:hypothetical protein
MYIQSLTEVIFSTIINIVGTHKNTIPILHQVSSTLLTLLRFIYTPVQVSATFVLTICFKLINFFFQKLPLLSLKVLLEGSIPCRQGIFLFAITYRLTLVPTQLPIQCVPAALSPAVKWLEQEASAKD